MLFAECNNLPEDEFEPLALRYLSSGQSGILSDATNLVAAPKHNSHAVATTITNDPSGKLGQEWGWFGTGKYDHTKTVNHLTHYVNALIISYYENDDEAFVCWW